MTSSDASQWNSQQPAFRGIFSEDDHDEMYNPLDWRAATEQFPNGVPRFVSSFWSFVLFGIFYASMGL
jgi:hypothetical protein